MASLTTNMRSSSSSSSSSSPKMNVTKQKRKKSVSLGDANKYIKNRMPTLDAIDEAILNKTRSERASMLGMSLLTRGLSPSSKHDNGVSSFNQKNRNRTEYLSDTLHTRTRSSSEDMFSIRRRASVSSSMDIWLNEDDDKEEEGATTANFEINYTKKRNNSVQQRAIRISGPPPATVPQLTICILVVGTRGDVQPFCAIGMRMRDQYGHRIRIATHAIYRNFVESLGLEFYPLAGDPKSLSAFMVKTKGNLFPTSMEQLHLMVGQPTHIAEIAKSTWPAVTAPDPEHPKVKFSCDAIIANPVCWGHYHCAEALRIPLHIMFPQPWSPTREFPHPLSRLSYSSGPSLQNLLSYNAMDMVMWVPIADEINCLRRDVLRIPPIRIGERPATVVSDMKVPMSFMWSPSLCPKPSDWGDHISVLGNIFLDNKSTGGSTYEPSQELGEFLFGDDYNNTNNNISSKSLNNTKKRVPPAPIFIGFGSMMIKDPMRLTRMIIAASIESNTRVLIQSSWSSMSDGTETPDNVFFLGPCPHDWLLPHMAAVIHHGGAGTTAAGLRCGKPTFICPFFGDQHFWGAKVQESGVGLAPCPIENLTEEVLIEAFQKLAKPRSLMRTKAQKMAMRWQEGIEAGENILNGKDETVTSDQIYGRMLGHPEDGITNAVNAFHANLPLQNLHCDITEELLTGDGRPRVAKWVHVNGHVKICDEVLKLLTSPDPNDPNNNIPLTKLSDWRKWTPVKWGSHSVGGDGSASSIVDGYKRGVGALLHETVQGVADLVRQPYLGVKNAPKNQKLKGFAKGAATGVFNVVARPIRGVAELVDSVGTGHVAAVSGKPSQGMYKKVIEPAMNRRLGRIREAFTNQPRQKRTESIQPLSPLKEFGVLRGSTDTFEEVHRPDCERIFINRSSRLGAKEIQCKPILKGRSW